jgi:membrane fusion protein (multidrug efflux system)
MFRKQALEAHQEGDQYGEVLRLSPEWAHWAFWMLLGVAVFYGLFGVLGRMFEYATGPAVIRVDGRTDLSVSSPGIVASVEVQPGQRVKQGQVLVRLSDASEVAELARFDREFELQMIRRLQNLADEGARSALTTLRAQRELARSQLAQRLVVAPHDGVVSDVRVRDGQHLVPGDVAVAVVGEDSRLVVTAMLPGEYRPLLEPGAPLRLELRGFPYQYQALTIDSVGDELVGPTAVQRTLGPDLAESLTVEGAVVLVRASVPARFFEAEGEQLAYFDGMVGEAQAPVKSERILVMLVPGLKALLN